MKILKRFYRFILHAFFPTRCGVCGEVTEYGKAICSECEKNIYPLNMPVCHKCGASMEDHDAFLCNGISAEVIGAYYYGGKVKKLIIQLKDNVYIENFYMFRLAFFERIAIEYADINFDITVAVPSYQIGRRKKKNCSELIAEETAEHFMLKFVPDALIKCRETQKQHMLNGEERLTNLKGSIIFNSDKADAINGKTVLLCDDVKSTGSTLNECISALYKAGAKKVYCACICVSDYTIKT